MFVSCTLNHQIENVDSMPSQIKLNGSHFIDNAPKKKGYTNTPSRTRFVFTTQYIFDRIEQFEWCDLFPNEMS